MQGSLEFQIPILGSRTRFMHLRSLDLCYIVSRHRPLPWHLITEETGETEVAPYPAFLPLAILTMSLSIVSDVSLLLIWPGAGSRGVNGGTGISWEAVIALISKNLEGHSQLHGTLTQDLTCDNAATPRAVLHFPFRHRSERRRRTVVTFPSSFGKHHSLDTPS